MRLFSKRRGILAAIAAAVAFVVPAANAALMPGVYDPDNTHACTATYVGGVLTLTKSAPTSTNCAAGADVTGFEGLALHQLSFDVKLVGGESDLAHCTTGAPRFDVMTTEGLYYFGCASGTPSPAGPGWVHLEFGETTPYCDGANAEQTNCFNGAVQWISVIMDEQGTVQLRNISVNGQIQVPAPAPTPTPQPGPKPATPPRGEDNFGMCLSNKFSPWGMHNISGLLSGTPAWAPAIYVQGLGIVCQISDVTTYGLTPGNYADTGLLVGGGGPGDGKVTPAQAKAYGWINVYPYWAKK
ncbi:MAG: hypothetical protein JWO96_128 [Candidatus Saccharibacteria bacterium]|nr:hypothetical protein [Candidatus Saccharibacteria bacterium]